MKSSITTSTNISSNFNLSELSDIEKDDTLILEQNEFKDNGSLLL